MKENAITNKPDTKCKFCGGWFNGNDEGYTYRDGTAAHDEMSNKITADEAQENAALIVRAVNEWEALKQKADAYDAIMDTRNKATFGLVSIPELELKALNAVAEAAERVCSGVQEGCNNEMPYMVVLAAKLQSAFDNFEAIRSKGK